MPDAGGKVRSTLQHELDSMVIRATAFRERDGKFATGGCLQFQVDHVASSTSSHRDADRQHGPPMWGGLGILLSLARSHRAAPAEALSTPPLPPPLGMCHRLLSKGELARALPATDK